jgi:hypothetical protein
MGNWFSEMDRKKALKQEQINEDRLKAAGIPIPTEATTKVPDFPDKVAAISWYGLVIARLSAARRQELYTQPFRIGSGQSISYVDRKAKSIIDPDNPFPLDKGEAEERLLRKASEKVKSATGLKHGGYRGRHHGRNFGL